MSTGSAIEWTEATWNPTTGCDKVSPGCDNCYALTLAKRLKGMGSAKYQTDGNPATSGPGFGLAMHDDALTIPLRWRKPRRIFVNSMSDLFHEKVADEFIARVWAVMAMAPQHTFQVLTKRHARMRSLLGSHRWWTLFSAELAGLRQPGQPIAYDADGPKLPNVWLGVSVENQQWADIRIPVLLETPTAVRWISAEPLLGPVDLVQAVNKLDWLSPSSLEPGGIDWVVVGGESGPDSRPMHPDWARSLRNQCVAASVPFFFKQWGEWGPAPFRVPVCDPKVGWTGTAVDLAAAKRDSEARGATHVHTGNRYEQNGETVWHVHEIDCGKPWSIERGALTAGKEPIRKWGKKVSGRELDGQTWDEYPGGVS